MQPEHAGEPRAVSGRDVADNLGQARLLARGDVKVAHGEKSGRAEEVIHSVEQGVKVGHHAAPVSVTVAAQRDAPEGVGHCDKVELAGNLSALPLGENKGRRVLQKALHVLHPKRLESPTRDLEERATEVQHVHRCGSSANAGVEIPR